MLLGRVNMFRFINRERFDKVVEWSKGVGVEVLEWVCFCFYIVGFVMMVGSFVGLVWGICRFMFNIILYYMGRGCC